MANNRNVRASILFGVLNVIFRKQTEITKAVITICSAEILSITTYKSILLPREY